MNIIVKFLGGSTYWQSLILVNAKTASTVLSAPSTIDKISAFPVFDFTADTPAQVADKIAGAGDVTISVGFFWNPFARDIAYEESGAVYFNRAKQSRGAGSPGNIAHETMHALGFQHNGNSPLGQQNTVPWWVGNLVDSINTQGVS